MLSVIIPARNEIYLEKTLRSILAAAEGDIEVLAMLDGYVPNPQINLGDDRVIFHHFPQSIGQRQCVNYGAKEAKGKYIMKLDAHCSVDKGFDIKLAADCDYDWTVIPRMYNLDYLTWTPKLHKRTDYMYIGRDEGRLLRAEYYNSNQPKNDLMIDDTMCCMGPGWFMHKDRFWELGGMDENHGSWGQMGVELACKAWLSGGAMKVNKKTWFAHYFRGGGGPGFPYPISGRDQEKARQYSRDLWLNDKWPLQKRPFQWLIEKFSPPGWNLPHGLESFKDYYKGQTCYIVGKGLSLQNLKREHFKDGIVITINSAITQVEALNLPNLTYAMLKEGSGMNLVIRPKKAVLLTSKHEGAKFLTDYSPRYVFDAASLTDSMFGWKEFSANCALKIAQLFGCSKIKLLCFDACMGDEVRAVRENGEIYANKHPDALFRQKTRMLELIAKERLDVEWIKP